MPGEPLGIQVAGSHHEVRYGTHVMTAGTEILENPLCPMGRVVIVTVDTDSHVELFREVSLAVAGDLPQGAALEQAPDHDLRMAAAAGGTDIFLMDRRGGIIVAQNMVLCMTVKAEGQLLSRRGGSESQVDVFFVFFCLFWVTAGAIHIDEALPEVEVRIGVGMATHTEDFSRMVDILTPFFRIDVEGTDSAVAEDLGDPRLAVAKKTFLIGIGRCLGKGGLAGYYKKSGKNEEALYFHHPINRPCLEAGLRTFAEMSCACMNDRGYGKEFNDRHSYFPNLELIPRFKFGIGNMLTQ